MTVILVVKVKLKNEILKMKISIKKIMTYLNFFQLIIFIQSKEQ